MSKMSREKGKRFERTVANLFKKHGYADAHRSVQYCGNTGDAADVIGIPGIHVECKHQEKMRLYEWLAQSISDSKAEGAGNLPTVVHKANNKPILVTMRIEDWMILYDTFIHTRSQGMSSD